MPGVAAIAKVMPLLSFGTLVTAAVVPLAAGLYLVATTTWTAAERAYLQPLRTPREDAGKATEASAKAAGKAAAKSTAKRRSSAK